MAMKRKRGEDESTSLNQEVVPLVRSLMRHQLENILEEASKRHEDVMQMVTSMVAVSKRKIFIRGLSREAGNLDVYTVFSVYGEIVDCYVVYDTSTHRSKGFAFVIFKEDESAERSLVEPRKIIKDRVTMAVLESERDKSKESQERHRTVFVKHVPFAISARDLLQRFQKYGPIDMGPLGFEIDSAKETGYALFVFTTMEGVHKCLENRWKEIKGYKVYCEIAKR